MSYQDIWATTSFDKENLFDYRFFRAFYSFIGDRLLPYTPLKVEFLPYEKLRNFKGDLFLHPLQLERTTDPISITGSGADANGLPVIPKKTWTPFVFSWPSILWTIFYLSTYYVNRRVFKPEDGLKPFPFQIKDQWPDGFPEVHRDSKWKKPMNWDQCNFRRIFKRIITDTEAPYVNELHPLQIGSKAVLFPAFLPDSPVERARILYIRGKIFVWDGQRWNLDLSQSDPDYLTELGLPQVGDDFGTWYLEDALLALKQLKTVGYIADSVQYITHRQTLERDSVGNFTRIVNDIFKQRTKPWAGGVQPETLVGAAFSGDPGGENPNANIQSYTSLVGGENSLWLRTYNEGSIHWTKSNLTIRGGLAQIYFQVSATSTNESPYKVSDKFLLYKSVNVDQNSEFDFKGVDYEPWIFTVPVNLQNYLVVQDERNLLVQRNWSITGAYALYDWNFEYK